MTPTERRVLADLLTVARGRLTKAGHAAIVVTTEHRGHCPWRGGHSKTCVSVTGAIAAAEALLAEAEPIPFVQPPLLAPDRPDDDHGARRAG